MGNLTHVQFILALLPAVIHGANILFYFGGTATQSHWIGLEPLVVKLAERGHRITVFSPFEYPYGKSNIINTSSINIKTLFPNDLAAASNEFHENFLRTALRSRFKSKYRTDTARFPDRLEAGTKLCELSFKSPEIQTWVNSSHFDLLIIDKSSSAECAYALAYKFNAKIISYSATAGVLPWDLGLYGLPAESSWIPSYDVFYDSKEMGFFPRLFTELSGILWYYAYLSTLPKYDRIARDLLQIPQMPYLEDLIRREALIFGNIHYSDNYAKSLPPFFIPIGGMHLTETTTQMLPNETERFVRGGDSGFINFGNKFTTEEMPEPLVKIFFETFRSLQMPVLWKWSGKHPKDIPKNILLQSEFPHMDVLGHSKIKCFINHGDQMSMQEAIFHSVPVLIFPVSGDNDFNAKRVRRLGNGIELEFHELTTAAFTNAVLTLISDPKYSSTARIAAEASRIRQVAPVDAAVWWTEFVLSQSESVLQLLKPLSTTQPWWMLRGLDVWGFLFLVTCLGLYTVIILLYNMLKLIKNSTSHTKSKCE